MTPLKLKPIPPSRKNPAFVTRTDGSCGMEMVDGWARTVAGDALRAGRILCGLSLRDGATVLGLQPVEMSGLERGQYEISAEELGRALVRLALFAPVATPPPEPTASEPRERFGPPCVECGALKDDHISPIYRGRTCEQYRPKTSDKEDGR